MKYALSLVVVFLFLLGAGCGKIQTNENKVTDAKEQMYQSLNLDTPVQFAEITDSQDAVFYMGTGWTGGLGSYPVLENPGDSKRMNDLVLYVDDTQAKKLIADAGGLPSCYVGTPVIKIAAQIHIEQKTSKSYAVEEIIMQDYYSVFVDKLYNVFIQAEPCEE